MSARAPGVVLGSPGSSLRSDGHAFAANADVARVGEAGERRTAVVLDALARRPGGVSVLHDLRIPGSRANVDHVVVAGRAVTIIDSKAWRPAFYWSLGSRAFRGLERFEPGERDGAWMVARYAELLRSHGVEVRMATPLKVVWPSSSRATMRLGVYRSAGVRTVSGETFTRRAASLVGRGSADRRAVEVLASLLHRAS